MHHRSHRTLNLLTEMAENSLITQGWIGNKLCLVTIDTGTYVAIASPNIAAGGSERKRSQSYRMKMAK
jgi:hypothetical protein